MDTQDTQIEEPDESKPEKKDEAAAQTEALLKNAIRYRRHKLGLAVAAEAIREVFEISEETLDQLAEAIADPVTGAALARQLVDKRLADLKAEHNPRHLQLLAYLDAHPEGAQTRELAEEIGEPSDKCSYTLSMLRSAGWVVRSAGREGVWTRTEKKDGAYWPSDARQIDTTYETLKNIYETRGTDPFTGAEFAAMMGMAPSSAPRTMSVLRAKGLIQRAGEKQWAIVPEALAYLFDDITEDANAEALAALNSERKGA